MIIVKSFEVEDPYFSEPRGIHKYNCMKLVCENDGKTFGVDVKQDIEEIFGKEKFSNSEITFMRKTKPKKIELSIYGKDRYVRRRDLIAWHKRFKSHREYVYGKKYVKN